MRKRELLLGIIIAMATVFAAGCGTKSKNTDNQVTTYNTVNSMVPETKHPTVIIPDINTKAPEISKEPVKTNAPTKQEKQEKQDKQKKVQTDTKEKKATAKPKTQPKKQEPVKQEKKPVKNVQGMVPIMTTIASYMSEGLNYDATDESCYYSIMYMLGNNVAEKSGRVEHEDTDNQFYVKENVMQALSAAAFSDHKMIGKVGPKYDDIVKYDSQKKVYIMYESDDGEVKGKIKDSYEKGNGTYIVRFDLCAENGDTIGCYEFTLVQNQSKYTKISPNFYYRVKSVKKLTE